MKYFRVISGEGDMSCCMQSFFMRYASHPPHILLFVSPSSVLQKSIRVKDSFFSYLHDVFSISPQRFFCCLSSYLPQMAREGENNGGEWRCVKVNYFRNG